MYLHMKAMYENPLFYKKTKLQEYYSLQQNKQKKTTNTKKKKHNNKEISDTNTKSLLEKPAGS